MKLDKLRWQIAYINILEKKMDGRQDTSQCTISWCGDGPEEGGRKHMPGVLGFQTAAP